LLAQHHPAHRLQIRKICNGHAVSPFTCAIPQPHEPSHNEIVISIEIYLFEHPQANECRLQISPAATMGYEDSVYLAKLAEQAERYEGRRHSYRGLITLY
jgi:hypothetical protein